MGVHYDPSRRNYIVRQQDGGRRRTCRFDAKAEAVAFAKTVVTRDRGRPPSAGIDQDDQEVDEAVAALGRARPRRDAIYAYETAEGTRWRFQFRQSDGTLSSRRGFTSHNAAASARRRLLEEIRRGEVRVSRESFETFWHRVLRDKKPFMTAGSYEDFTTHGRKRLLPFSARTSSRRSTRSGSASGSRRWPAWSTPASCRRRPSTTRGRISPSSWKRPCSEG